ncbi:GNAT family N-acetyltransferase [Lachnospiraceae bacterium]|nr:GNAT family N-acetyltransferase [Lachnospiraceae bacterium]
MLEIPRVEEVMMEGEECRALRPLWEEVFSEDSKEFTDYYFKEKAVHNRAFGLRIGEGCVSMLYLSPYRMMMRCGGGFAEQEINYIVGVATKEKYRHRGYMDRILRLALTSMKEKRQPFTFLMPANPRIYRPYSFTYIYDREIYLPKEQFPEETVSGRQFPKELAGRPYLTEKELQELAKFASAYLEKNYDLFIKRDMSYYRVMERELEAQNGRIYRLFGKDGALEGYFFYTEEEGRGEIQEAVFLAGKKNCPVCTSGRRQPVIMARVVDVQAMFSLLRTKTKEISWSVKIEDSILLQNNGVWQCRITPDRAFVCKKLQGEGEKSGGNGAECRAEVGQLTAWIFGYRKAEECFSFFREREKEGVLEKLNEIKKLGRVFINEIV